MKNLRQILLSNGIILRIDGNMLWGFDDQHSPITFTPAQRKILHCLAVNLNHPVSMTALYEAYADQGVQIDDKGIRDNVTKIKNTIPPEVKSSVKSVRGYGYKLAGTFGTDANVQPPFPADVSPEEYPQRPGGHLDDLSGDYYGFYLDPFGNKTILGLYLHIENEGSAENPRLTAHAIVNVRGSEVLTGDDIARVFAGSALDYSAAFRAFKQGLSDNAKRCSLLHGSVYADGTLVDIQLGKDDSPEQWKIMLDVAEFLRCRRDRDRDSNRYRGGLGITLATRTFHGTFCFRVGIVRRTCINDAMIQNQDEMIKRLKIPDDTENAVWKPLKLSGYMDKIWYEWIMNK